MNDPVINRAKEIVNQPITKFGFGDIGDVIVSYLRNKKTIEEAIENLNSLNEFYDRYR